MGVHQGLPLFRCHNRIPKLMRCKLLLSALAICLALSSCYTKKQAVRKFCTPSREISRDSAWKDSSGSVNNSTSISDSTHVTPAITLEVEFNPCDSLNGVIDNLNLILSAGSGSMVITSRGGKIQAKCNCDSTVSRMRSEIQRKDSVIKVYQGQKSYKEVVPPPEIIEKLPWWGKPVLVILALLSIPSIIWLFKRLTLKR